MLLTDRILDACARLRDGSIRSEQAVSQSVVLPILDALGWPRSDPRFVVPEYSVGNGRVDFALLTHGRAAVFVEVKQPGMAGQADRQLFQYAYHEGIQIAVLTDGKTWHVYGPGLRGTYDERKVCRVDLLNESPEDSAKHLRRYLDRDAVDSEQAEEHVRSDYKLARERRIARAELPAAWAMLATDPRLADLLAAGTKSLCGFQPEAADVAAFLTALRSGAGTPPTLARPARPQPEPALSALKTRADPPSRLISDLLSTLEIIRRDYSPSTERSITELRIAAVNEIAIARNVSAQTVADAHRRRLEPELRGSEDFDAAVSEWINGRQSILKTALVSHSPTEVDRLAVEAFFS